MKLQEFALSITSKNFQHIFYSLWLDSIQSTLQFLQVLGTHERTSTLRCLIGSQINMSKSEPSSYTPQTCSSQASPIADYGKVTLSKAQNKDTEFILNSPLQLIPRI